MKCCCYGACLRGESKYGYLCNIYCEYLPLSNVSIIVEYNIYQNQNCVGFTWSQRSYAGQKKITHKSRQQWTIPLRHVGNNQISCFTINLYIGVCLLVWKFQNSPSFHLLSHVSRGLSLNTAVKHYNKGHSDNSVFDVIKMSTLPVVWLIACLFYSLQQSWSYPLCVFGYGFDKPLLLTHWGRDKMATILQTTFSFLSWKCFNFEYNLTDNVPKGSNWQYPSIRA